MCVVEWLIASRSLLNYVSQPSRMRQFCHCHHVLPRYCDKQAQPAHPRQGCINRMYGCIWRSWFLDRTDLNTRIWHSLKMIHTYMLKFRTSRFSHVIDVYSCTPLSRVLQINAYAVINFSVARGSRCTLLILHTTSLLYRIHTHMAGSSCNPLCTSRPCHSFYLTMSPLEHHWPVISLQIIILFPPQKTQGVQLMVFPLFVDEHTAPSDQLRMSAACLYHLKSMEWHPNYPEWIWLSQRMIESLCLRGRSFGFLYWKGEWRYRQLYWTGMCPNTCWHGDHSNPMIWVYN